MRRPAVAAVDGGRIIGTPSPLYAELRSRYTFFFHFLCIPFFFVILLFAVIMSQSRLIWRVVDRIDGLTPSVRGECHNY